VLAPALWWHGGDRALEDLQERLLHAFARHVARDRRVVRLARDLVDLVDVDDPGLRLLDVEVSGLDELQEDVLDVLTDIPRLGECGRVGDRERDVQDPRERLGEEGLPATCRPEEEDVRFLELDLPVLHPHAHALVVVVDRHGEGALRLLLGDDVVVEDGVDVKRLGEVVEVELRRSRELLVDDLVAEIDALVADVDPGTSDQLLDLSLTFPAEAAKQLLVTLARPSHVSPFTPVTVSCARPEWVRSYERCSITRSMSPYSWASAAVM
jgi:hypothetical protein